MLKMCGFMLFFAIVVRDFLLPCLGLRVRKRKNHLPRYSEHHYHCVWLNFLNVPWKLIFMSRVLWGWRRTAERLWNENETPCVFQVLPTGLFGEKKNSLTLLLYFRCVSNNRNAAVLLLEYYSLSRGKFFVWLCTCTERHEVTSYGTTNQQFGCGRTSLRVIFGWKCCCISLDKLAAIPMEKIMLLFWIAALRHIVEWRSLKLSSSSWGYSWVSKWKGIL